MALEIQDLRESNDFLNTLFDHIPSAVFIVDRNLRIHNFNNSFETLFFRPEDEVLGNRWGNVIGCEFSVKEERMCGTTSHCSECSLRSAFLRSFTQKVPTYREKLTREFFINNKPVLKYLQFSTKYISYQGQEMVLIIVDDITEAETQRLRLDEDLKAAAEIQRSLLPSVNMAIDTVDLAWKFIPCQRLGGDIFNMVRLDEDHWAVYMIDVSGHGVPSAVVAVFISQMLQPQAGYILKRSYQSPNKYEITPPAEVMGVLDRAYPIDRFNDFFFTMSYLVLNSRTGCVTYSNAGHPPPVIMRRNGVMEILREGGPIIGMGGLFPFHEGQKRLRSGDKLFLYTDGLIEHENKQGVFFGKDRFYGVLRAFNGDRISVLVEELVESLWRFGEGAEIQDDISLLGMEFKLEQVGSCS